MSPKLKITITATVTVLVIALIWLFAVLPFMDRIKQSSADFAEARARLNQAELALADVARLENELKPYPELSAYLKKPFLNQNRIVELLTTLETMAKKLGLRYDIQLLSSNDKNRFNFQISLVGDFTDTARFINGLENLPFLNEVLRWQISRDNPASGPLKGSATSTPVTAGLTVSVFVKEGK